MNASMSRSASPGAVCCGKCNAKGRRKHTDNREGNAADLHRLSNHGRQTAEAPLKQAVRQQDALCIVFGQQTAQQRPCARDVPKITTDGGHAFLGGLAADDQVEILRAIPGHVLEDLRVLLPHQVIAARRGRVHREAIGIRGDPDEPLRVRVGKRAQQDRMHEGEHGGIQADADGQRQDRDTGDERRSPQLAQPEPRVLDELIETKPHVRASCARDVASTPALESSSPHVVPTFPPIETDDTFGS